MGYLRDLVVGAVASLLAAEVYVYADPVARWIVGKAAKRLLADDRDRRHEEWLADLNDMPGAVGKLLWALGCHWAATVTNVRRSWRAAHPIQVRQAVDRWNVRVNALAPSKRIPVFFGSGAFLGGIAAVAYEVSCESPTVAFVTGSFLGAIMYFVALIIRPRSGASGS
jgi:hypothetical protein